MMFCQRSWASRRKAFPCREHIGRVAWSHELRNLRELHGAGSCQLFMNAAGSSHCRYLMELYRINIIAFLIICQRYEFAACCSYSIVCAATLFFLPALDCQLGLTWIIVKLPTLKTSAFAHWSSFPLCMYICIRFTYNLRHYEFVHIHIHAYIYTYNI